MASRKGSGKRGAELFKEGKFEEASEEFTKWLEANPNASDKDKKVGHYNRARAFYSMGKWEESLKDADACIRIDLFWAKGYKCKAMALERLERPREATEALVDGKKMADGRVDDDYEKLLVRLNNMTGFLKGDLGLENRKDKGEKYCVVCCAFEADKGEKFLSCKRCRMVNYCSKEHEEDNRAEHEEEACGMLQKIREEANQLGIHPNALCFDTVERIEKLQMNCWEDWFSLPEYKEMWRDLEKCSMMMLTDGTKKALTHALTDPLTLFHVMKEAKLLDNKSGKLLHIHVVGAEPQTEGKGAKLFMRCLTSLYGPNIRVTMIGPHMPMFDAPNGIMTSFGGTYQEYMKTRDYKRPDLIAAFYPGLYDMTYTWQGVVKHAIKEDIPFLATCNSRKDYRETKELLDALVGIQDALPILENLFGGAIGSVMEELGLPSAGARRPKLTLDGPNPFSSWKTVAFPRGSNDIHGRNMYSILLK